MDDISKITVSVIITTYKRLDSCKRAIVSILKQNQLPHEIIIVEDNSDSGIQQWLKDKCLFNIRYIRNSYKRGLAASRNLGWQNATGDFIAYIDDDDEWKPDSLQKRMEVIAGLTPEELHRIGVIYCGAENHIQKEHRITYNMPKHEGDIKKSIIKKDLFTIPSSCIFPQKILWEIGGFDEKLVSSIDHDIWMNLANNGFYACAVHSALTITYQKPKGGSMVADTTPRIKGIEQFLLKWKPVYIMWFGEKKAKQYIKQYRIRVLGVLAGKKIAEMELDEAKKIILHVLNNNSISYSLSLFTKIIRIVLNQWLPIRIKLLIIKNHKHFRRKQRGF